ncbi:hypothetical protein [Bdellovibrio bacteriovorus]|uniref:Uncharacterized protein n=1 Tax=Bdellovibrio bacteriovorus str. Tiberius TaxID=1069642 RepID=K7YT98_BDEBC|nr:hypothetical protein [Bdellovibrio bacteriovorus]AFY00853.1 hypothetical protein Bdt_1153 [Bdellovibrio bacteriovorus str. Tiberius]
MKSIVFAFALLALPALSQAQTCYRATEALPAGVPAILCMDSLALSADETKLEITTEDYSVPAFLDVVSTSRHNEDKLNFKAQGSLVDIWQSGCGEGLSAKLQISGRTEYGEIYPHTLNVSVEVAETNDTCHSKPSKYTVPFALITE